MSTITAEEQAKIKSYLDTHVLPKGLGSEESACSIAAINLSLYGKLTDEIPDCMSNVIGRWIIRIQDSMPDEMRNSAKWKILLPMAAGTGRDEGAEKRRIKFVLNWMWDTVLPHILPIAEKGGFGYEWQAMCNDKTVKSATEAKEAADAAAYAADAAATYAAAAAAANAADAADAAADAAAYATAYADAANAYAAAADAANAYAADAADATADAAATYAAAAAAANAADAADAAADADAADAYARKEAWDHFDPCSLLEKLIEA